MPVASKLHYSVSGSFNVSYLRHKLRQFDENIRAGAFTLF